MGRSLQAGHGRGRTKPEPRGAPSVGCEKEKAASVRFPRGRAQRTHKLEHLPGDPAVSQSWESKWTSWKCTDLARRRGAPRLWGTPLSLADPNIFQKRKRLHSQGRLVSPFTVAGRLPPNPGPHRIPPPICTASARAFYMLWTLINGKHQPYKMRGPAGSGLGI